MDCHCAWIAKSSLHEQHKGVNSMWDFLIDVIITVAEVAIVDALSDD